jgi:hypothetical protein
MVVSDCPSSLLNHNLRGTNGTHLDTYCPYLHTSREVITPACGLIMPVLEITQLRLKGITVADSALLKNLSAVRDKLQTNSVFYCCIEDPTLVYIFGIWHSLDAHLEFLASSIRDAVLGPQADILDFEWTVHQELDAVASLPLNAPVLAIERLLVQGWCVPTFEQAVIRHARLLQENHSTETTHGWRCDAPAGTHEAIIFSGCKDTKPHTPFSGRRFVANDNADIFIEGGYEQVMSHRLWNLEHKVS